MYYIRTEQIFGLISVVFLYMAVILTPISKLIGKKLWLQKLLFARRGFGVSAAYFAILHVYLVMTEQIGGFSGLTLLPMRFKVSFILGTLALVILFLMAATSFDKAIKVMTFPRWKMLHRFVYPAGLLIIVHIWLIGTHAEKSVVRIAGFVALGILFALEAMRISNIIAIRYKMDRARNVLVFVMLFVLMTGALFLLPVLTKNYHSEHHDDNSAGMSSH